MAAGSDPDGFVKVSRRFFKHEWTRDRHGPWSVQEAWLDLIQLAAFSEGLEHLSRGEVEVSERWASRRWLWSKTKTHKQLQKWMEEGRLEVVRGWTTLGTTSGTTKRTTLGTTYLLANYGRYQGSRTTLGTTSGTTSGTTLGTKREEGSKRRRHLQKKAGEKKGGLEALLDQVKIPEELSQFAAYMHTLREWLIYKGPRGYKPMGLQKLITQQAKLGAAEAVVRMDHAMASTWKGCLHEVKGGNGQASPFPDTSRQPNTSPTEEWGLDAFRRRLKMGLEEDDRQDSAIEAELDFANTISDLEKIQKAHSIREWS